MTFSHQGAGMDGVVCWICTYAENAFQNEDIFHLSLYEAEILIHAG